VSYTSAPSWKRGEGEEREKGKEKKCMRKGEEGRKRGRVW